MRSNIMANGPKFEDTEELSFEDTEAVETVKTGQTHTIDPVTRRSVPLPEGVASEEGGELKAMALGAVEAIPGAKDLAAGGEAVLGGILDGNLEQIGEQYNSNLATINKHINESEDKFPDQFFAGDIGASLALPMGKGIKAAMAMSGLSSVSRLESRNPWDMVDAAKTGVAIGAGGALVAKGISSSFNFVGRKLGFLSKSAGANAMHSGSTGEAEQMAKHNRKFYNQEGNKTAHETTNEFVDDIMKQKVDGEDMFVAGQSFERTAQKAGIKKDQIGRQMGEALDGIDGQVKVSGQDVYDDISSNLRIEQKLRNPNITDAEKLKLQAQKHALEAEFFSEVQTGVEKIKKQVKDVDIHGAPILRNVEELVPVFERKAKEYSVKGMHELKLSAGKNPTSFSGFKKIDKIGDKQVLSAAQEVNTAITSTLGRSAEKVVSIWKN